MTPAEWKRNAVRALRERGCPYPEADAGILLEHVTGARGHELRFRGALTQDEEKALAASLGRRLSGEPVQYVTGEAYFMGLRFLCDPRSLIPQPDTELLCEAACEFAKRTPSPRVLDLCCGSGCVGLALAKRVAGVRLTLCDVSAPALELARENAELLGVEARFCLGDMFAPVRGETFDVIACNPPYIRTGEIRELPEEVRREPALALDGGEDGLAFYRVLAGEAGDLLSEGGVLLAEIGYDQEQDVSRLFPGCSVTRDIGGNPRVMTAERKIVWATQDRSAKGSRGSWTVS